MVDEEIQNSWETVVWYHAECGTEFSAPNEDTAKCPTCGKILENGMPRRDRPEA